MDWLKETEAILSLIIALMSGGLFPFLIKLYKDKKKLKRQAEIKQDLEINKLHKKVEKLAEIIDFYIQNNGAKQSIKKQSKNKLKELKRI